MKWRRRTAVEPDDLVVPYWQAHDAELLSAGLGAIARRLPTLVRDAVGVAWQASRADTAATLGLNVLAGLFTAFGLLATNDVLESLFAAGATADRVRAAIPALLVVAAAAGLRAGMLAVATWAQERLKPQVERLAETRLFRLTTRVELTAFDDEEFHNSMQRARDNGVPDSATVVEMTVNVLTGVIGVLSAAITLGVLHPALMPLLLVTAVPDGWAALRSARMRYAAFRRVSTARRRKFLLSDLMAERPPAAEVRAFTLRRFLLDEYDRVADHEQRVELDVAWQRATTRMTGDLLGGVALAVVYATLGLMLAFGVVPLAVVGTAVLTIRASQSSLTSLMQSVNKLYEAGLYFGDYLEFCALAERFVPPERSGELAPFHRLEADSVRFTYPGAETPALDGVSVAVERGEVVALVGENGSGKTTLAKLLAGLYRPDSGAVRWNGVDLAEVSGDALRERISVIAQDHTRWPLTAAQNITMGRPRDDERMDEAARASGADAVLARLEHGYETLLDRRFRGGHDLSGGQWQRIAIARAFYRDADVMVFDEPTSALDPRAEHALFERIRRHAAGRTVVLISHRLSSVRYADRIYVLDRGRVVEQGTHAELQLAGGRYAELYELQAAAYREPSSA